MIRLARIAASCAVVALLASCGTATTATPSAHSTHAGGHGAKAAPVAAPLRDGERFESLTMAEPYTPNAPNGGTDDYRCFVIDPKLTKQAFLTGAQFQPQNADIVHHAIFFRLDPGQAAKAKALDDGAPGQGWTCFGGSGVDDASWVAHWAPGTNETLLDSRYGYALPPGSKLVMQIHYNTLNVEGAPQSDKSGIRLRLTDKKLEPLETALLPGPVELPCTPQESGALCDRAAAVKDVARRFGPESEEQPDQLAKMCGPVKPGPTQHCDRPVPGPITLHAMAGHMHLLGRSIKVELNPGTPEAQTLLNVPNYDFDDQALRVLAKPVTLKKGDILRVTCTHDAGLRAQLPQLRKLRPRYVVWGEGTSDEMCLGLAIWSKAA
jgi:hypothetical protein